MKRKLLSITITALLAALAGYSANVIAAKGSPGPPPGVGGGGGEGEETTGNNLAYPAMLFSSDGAAIKPYAFAAVEGTFKTNYSYGCAKPQIVGTFEYPNTSCVTGWKEDGTAIDFLNAAACVAENAPCADLQVDRIYWQKVSGNVWNAESAALNSPATVRFVDWGDSIESVTWGTSSILRVETQGYADLSQDRRDDPFTVCDTAGTQCQAGLQMWHSQGHGTNEQWGARVTEVAASKGSPYVYGSPYAIVNAGTASLYLSKMSQEGAACPTEYAGLTFTDRPWTGVGWEGACNLAAVPYTVELSVTGKYVHGYNWRMRDLPEAMPVSTYCPDVMAPATWNKAGWWRLTFVPNGGTAKMRFADSVAIVPPVTPSSAPAVVTTAAVTAEEGETDTGPLYKPVVSPYGSANLTYIDICIAAKTGGGGGGGGKGGGGKGGGGGGPPTGGGGGGGGGPPTGGGGGGPRR